MDRFLVALALATAVILPFVVPALRIGSLPPPGFVAGSAAQRAYDAVDAVQPGSLVLIGIEYGPTATGELDGMTNDLLRHVLMRAAYPVLIGGDPVGLLHASDLIGSINADAAFLQRIGSSHPLAANQDYYVVRYLPGSVIGLRAFSADTANLLLTDIGGQATDLRVRSLKDFALVVVITDRAESLRAYAEQVAPLTQSPLVAAVSYSAAPLVEPYTSALGAGLLVGYGDSYTYNGLLDNVQARSISQRIRIIPTDTPTPIPTPTLPPPTPRPQVAVTGEATAEATAQATIPPTTPPTPTPKPLGSATVNAAQPVNMRGGPGTNNPVLASVPPGTRMTVLGFNDDQSWVNVRLADGTEGWISAALLKLEAAPQSSLIRARQVIDGGPTRTPRPTLPPPTFAVPGATLAAPTEASGAASTESATPVPTITRRPPTATPSPTARPSATRQATPTAQATEAVTEAVASVPSAPLPPSPGYRDERWYAMNLGIIASALIISLGAVVNVLRDLLRRGRRR